ncbi:hypothetical protein FHY12_001386 [Xanthomonas arboricola]|nr:hypothetical protein [Xanthomonas euroxanthea]
MAPVGLHFSTCHDCGAYPPASRLPPPASRLPIPDSRFPIPDSRFPALEPYRTVWYVRDVLPRTTDAWQLPLGHPGPALRGRKP